MPHYKVEVPDDLFPGVRPQDIVLLAIVWVPEDPLRATVNLQEPLIVDIRGHRGLQWVPAESSYSLRDPLFPCRPEAVGV
ncbi:flagellar assembly protein FliW [Kyrpidia spormannii]|uniref:Flagellar assembly factor FliW n=2 Tax=Kyrpidia spormannii TaxID=2055160 RepID=A0ACA8ZD59_9BACL